MDQKQKNLMMISAFMMDGLLNKAGGGELSDILAAWGQGYIELVDAMTDQAEIIESCFDAGMMTAGDCPGVFDYEVTSQIGGFFARHILENGNMPTKEAIERHILDETVEFFASGMSGEQKSDLHAAIENNLHGTIDKLLSAKNTRELSDQLALLEEKYGYPNKLEVPRCYWHYGRHAEFARDNGMNELGRLFSAAWKIEHHLALQPMSTPIPDDVAAQLKSDYHSKQQSFFSAHPLLDAPTP